MKPLGLGSIGLHHQHARWYYPLWSQLDEYKLVAIAESDEAFLNSEKGFFGCDATNDYNELLAREDIDLVIIWLPHSQMPDAVAAAAAAGKHIIVEKPCCSSVAGAEAILKVAQQYPDIKISSPYCWRNHLVSDQIRQAMHSGLFGKITAMEARLNAGGAHRYVRDNQLWMLNSSEGGGPMWNLGVHWIDFFRWLTGAEIVEVSGMTTPPTGEPGRTIEDNAQALLRFDNGAVAVLDISYAMKNSYPGHRDIYVSMRGTDGAATWSPAWEGTTDSLLLVSEADGIAEQDHCRTLEITSPEIAGYCGHMAWSWLKEFAHSIDQDTPAQVSPADILAAVKVTDAFYRSVKSGQTEKV